MQNNLVTNLILICVGIPVMICLDTAVIYAAGLGGPFVAKFGLFIALAALAQTLWATKWLMARYAA